MQRSHCWKQSLVYVDRCGDMHGGGKRVVGRLPHVDVVIRMNRCLGCDLRAGELTTAVRDHFVHVHVELRAAAGHPDVQRKHVVMLAGEYFVADPDDQLVTPVVEPIAGMVRIGGGLFQNGIRGDHLARHEVLADAEVLERALCLGSPKFVRRNLDLAKTVGFDAKFSHTGISIGLISSRAVMEQRIGVRGRPGWSGFHWVKLALWIYDHKERFVRDGKVCDHCGYAPLRLAVQYNLMLQ
jgi:hypothetical protein